MSAYEDRASAFEVYGEFFVKVIDFPVMGTGYGPFDTSLYSDNFEDSQDRRAQRWVTWAKP